MEDMCVWDRPDWYDVPVKPSIINAAPGWISPEGKYYQCPYCYHWRMAVRIVATRYGKPYAYADDIWNRGCYTSDAENYLDRLGWIKITDHGTLFYRDVDAITQAQLDVLSDMTLFAGYIGDMIDSELRFILGDTGVTELVIPVEPVDLT